MARTPPHLATIGRSLVGIHNWTFLFGPNLILGLNTVMLAYLMFSSRLVPRFIAVLGLFGGSLIFVSGTAVMFGLYTQGSTVGLIAGLPVFAWEVSLALWLIIKGFNSECCNRFQVCKNAIERAVERGTEGIEM